MRMTPIKPFSGPMPMLGHAAGRYYLGSMHVMGASSFIVGADTLIGQPFFVPKAHTYDRLAVLVTAPETGASVRLGVYRHGAGELPGSLLLDAGVVSLAVEQKVELTVSLALQAGWYWLAMLSDATGTGRVSGSGTVGGNPELGHTDADGTSFYRYVRRSVTFGALPDPFGTPVTYDASSVVPRVWLRA